jgi:hypothetical protein
VIPGKDTTVTDFQCLTEDYSDTREEALQILQQSTESVIEACQMQLGFPLWTEGPTAQPDQDCSTFGSGIALTAPTGGFNLMLVGNERSTKTLTRRLFFMEDDEEVGREEIADGLGELVNMAAGAVKTQRSEDKPDLQLGLPLFLTGSGCLEFLVKGIYASAQALEGPGEIRLQMVVVWKGSAPLQ